MNTQLKKSMTTFRDITIQLIEELNAMESDNINELFDKRQQEIEKMDQLSYSKDEFLEISLELNIVELDNKLRELTTLRYNESKEVAEKYQEVRNANMKYNKTTFDSSSHLNTTT